MASIAADSAAGTAGCGPAGSAASIGKAGSGPSAEPAGATTVPVPKAKPGPRVNEIAQMIAFGT